MMWSNTNGNWYRMKAERMPWLNLCAYHRRRRRRRRRGRRPTH